MNPRLIVHTLGAIILLVGSTMATAIAWAAVDGSPDLAPLVYSCAATCLVGAAMFLVKPRGRFSLRDGFAIVGVGWFVIAGLGALPFHLSGYFATYSDAFFESVSGFTTTGATVLANVEALPRGLLFWRSLTHWLGGMGIIVLSLAVFSVLNTGMPLYRAEVPGFTHDKLLPRLRQTSLTLWVIYAGLTLVETIALMMAGLSLFDSLTHAFGTIATGGLSTRAISVEAFDSLAVEIIIVVFMALAGLNFALYWKIVQRKGIRAVLADAEARLYALIIIGASITIAVSLVTALDMPLLTAVRRAVFQVVSINTTTGFSSTNFDAWPSLAKGVLLALMFVGGCTGSTAGGMKVGRFLLLFSQARRHVLQSARPRLVVRARVGNTVVEDSVVSDVLTFFFIYIMLYCLGVFAVLADGQDLVTSLSASAAMISNVGPGFGAVGPYMNYGELSTGVKYILSGLMVAGRLELMPVLLLFSRAFWRK
jgi:trk system potassium uptake protein TrkH